MVRALQIIEEIKMTTEQIEGQLIKITDEMARTTLLPLTDDTSAQLLNLCGKVSELLGKRHDA